jgi:hypothetical protein
MMHIAHINNANETTLMTGQDRDIRLQVMLKEDEMAAIEEWRFGKRMPSRAAAIRELLRRGLEAEGFAFAPTGKQSGDFNVAEAAPPARKNGNPVK